MIKEYNIADGVKAFSTTRKGGVSTGNYGEFNINEYCGDEAVNIAANRKHWLAFGETLLMNQITHFIYLLQQKILIQNFFFWVIRLF